MKKAVYIEKLPSGNYSVRHWEGSRFVREWFEDFSLAKQRAANLTLKLTALKQGLPDPTLTPLQIMENYLASLIGTHRESTRKMKRAVLEPLLKDVQHLNTNKVLELKHAMMEKLSISTVSIRLRELRALCNWAKKQGMLEDIFENIEIPASEEGGYLIPLEDMKKIWDASDMLFKPFLAFLIYTGARYGEIIKTKWSDINLENAVWHIPAENVKTKQERYVPLVKPLVSVLKDIVPTTNFVFTGWSKNTARWYLAKACRKAGLAKIPTPHDFRHSYASYWEGDIRDLMKNQGWRSMLMVKRYDQRKIERVRMEAEHKGIAAFLPKLD